ncbi:MAG: NAD-dependent epimerase/dehydratase family protein [Acidimicrobiales bacterium]
MRILVIGGSSFVGRHITERALNEGHTVTLFNRGETNPGAFPGVEQILGDRNVDLSRLTGREWDATIDVCAYVPRQVRTVLAALGSGAGLYTFISTISVYPEDVPARFAETAAVVEPSYETEVSMELYGALKVGCELTAQQLVGDERLCVVRPGYVVGPYDPTHRFTYWIERVAAGGRILGPSADQPLQVIDGRDLAAFVVGLVENDTADVFHATAPDPAIPFASVLDEIAGGLGLPAPEVQWGEASDLLPLSDPGESWGMLSADVAKGVSHGLAWRPLAETARDTLAWVRDARAAGTYRERPGVLTPEQERQILAGGSADS